jgi:3D (Asp-Asp-Asp) domain-containing protein
MAIKPIHLRSKAKKTLLILIVISIIWCTKSISDSKGKAVDIGTEEFIKNRLSLMQGNTVLNTLDPSAPEPEVVRRINMIVTAYSSTPLETDDDPYTTAAGTTVRDGIVANNLLPMGTKIKMPDIYGDRVFVVEDRMHWKKGYYHVDIWFPSYWEAKNFGAITTQIEVLEG